MKVGKICVWCNLRLQNFHTPENLEVVSFNSQQKVQCFYLFNGTIEHVISSGDSLVLY